ncbi:hypothetical protein VNO78_05123 [Psophocarpus tetragonolobus]|uniref:Uncharacterized protein n=1 Tax=Psophocarpus tetragonolobus TaxID=3891 RepID=A0AAN9T0A6_PSOTE
MLPEKDKEIFKTHSPSHKFHTPLRCEGQQNNKDKSQKGPFAHCLQRSHEQVAETRTRVQTLKLTPTETEQPTHSCSGFFIVPRGKFWNFLGASSGLFFNLKTHQGISHKRFLVIMPTSVADLVLVGFPLLLVTFCIFFSLLFAELVEKSWTVWFLRL